MNELKMFSKWLKKSLDSKLIFQNHVDYCIVADGYVGYKISVDNKPYINEIKRQTFQNLEEDFVITYREIKFENLADLDRLFNCDKRCKETKLYYKSMERKLKIFIADGEYVFVNEDYIDQIDTAGYKCYGEGGTQPVVFKSDKLFYIVLPVRVGDFNYEIKGV